MRVIDAIKAVDETKVNTYSQREKIEWLSRLDGMIKTEIIDTHEDGEDIEFDGYDDSDLETELLVPAPYDDLYLRWLEVQIDYANGEYGKHANSMTMFEAAYREFAMYYNRKHMPKGSTLKFF